MDITTIDYSATAVVVDFVQSQFLRKSTRIVTLINVLYAMEVRLPMH